jgi:hypothetical protein
VENLDLLDDFYYTRSSVLEEMEWIVYRDVLWIKASSDEKESDAAQPLGNCWISFFKKEIGFISFYVDELYSAMEATRDFHSGRNDSGSTTFEKIKTLSKKCFVSIYPSTRFVYHALTLSIQIGYINNTSKYISPWHYISGQKITRIRSEDYKSVEELEKQEKLMFHKILETQHGSGRFLKWSLFHIRKIFQLLTFALPGAIFMFRFFEWWNSSEYFKKDNTFPIPPPPTHIKVFSVNIAARKRVFGHTCRYLPTLPEKTGQSSNLTWLYLLLSVYTRPFDK